MQGGRGGRGGRGGVGGGGGPALCPAFFVSFCS